MVLCHRCHKLVDDSPSDYPRASLEKMKNVHERRVRLLMSLAPKKKTAVVRFAAPIGGQRVAVGEDEVLPVLRKRYPVSRAGVEINLTALHGQPEDANFYGVAERQIRQGVESLLGPNGEGTNAGHVSLFALGPIPLLILLGKHLTNKVPLDLYQRHRDRETWAWKKRGTPVRYVFRTMQDKGSRAPVALVLSLSGTIRVAELPQETRDSATVYELTLDGMVPATTFLNLAADLESFRTTYQRAIAFIVKAHGLIPSIDLFAAVPAPVAVLCGRELLPKVHPGLRVFDRDRILNAYIQKLEIKHI